MWYVQECVCISLHARVHMLCVFKCTCCLLVHLCTISIYTKAVCMHVYWYVICVYIYEFLCMLCMHFCSHAMFMHCVHLCICEYVHVCMCVCAFTHAWGSTSLLMHSLPQLLSVPCPHSLSLQALERLLLQLSQSLILWKIPLQMSNRKMNPNMRKSIILTYS